MTMLPTPAPADRVVAVLSGNAEAAAALAAVQDLVGQGEAVLLAGLTDGLVCCDAAVAVIDADAGIDGAFADAWARLAGNHVPRVAVVRNSVGGRAEFSEVAAILERVTGDDVVSRFLPLADDEETHAAGVLDVLTGEITMLSGETRAADPEHVSLTSDESELLIDVLAHAVLTDAQLDSYLEGAPVSLPALRSGYAAACASGDDLVALLPAEPTLGGGALQAILAAVTRSWSAIVDTSAGSVDAASAGVCVGIGIDSGVARMWNVDSASDCEIVIDGSVAATVRCEGAVLRHEAIRAGAVVRPVGSDLVVRAPGL